jgi:GNAT superfamily N-acetyltransferase
MTFRIEPIRASADADIALEALLRESYVAGGFTDPALADTMFRGAAVRSRGIVLVALDQNATMLGTVTLVGAESAARRLAVADEAELHLLCVRPAMRGNGIGRALVQAALVQARTRGITAIVLWTQPTMLAAQRLYLECGFHREPSADFRRDGRQFLVYRHVLAARAP